MILNALKTLFKGFKAVLHYVVLLFTFFMVSLVYVVASAYLFLFED